MKVRWSQGLVYAAFGLAGLGSYACGAMKGIAGDMGVPVRQGERAGELAEQDAARKRDLKPGVYEFSASEGGAPRTSFRLGEPITGTLRASASPEEWYRKYTGDLAEAGRGRVLPSLFID